MPITQRRDGDFNMRKLTQKQLDLLRAYFKDEACTLTEQDFVRVWNNEIAVCYDSTIYTWDDLIDMAESLMNTDDIVDHFIYSVVHGDIPQRDFDEHWYTFDSYQYPIEIAIDDMIDFNDDDYIQALYDYYNDKCLLNDILDQMESGEWQVVKN